MHGSRLPLRVWVWGAHIVATSPDPVPVRHFQKLLGIRSYKAAFELRWVLLSLAQVEEDQEAPEDCANIERLRGVIEVNRTELLPKVQYPRFSRSKHSRVFLAAAIEANALDESSPLFPEGRFRLATISQDALKPIEAFVRSHVEPGSRLLIDNCKSYLGLTEYYLDAQGYTKPLRRTELLFSLVRSWFRKAESLDREAVDRALEPFLAGLARAKPRGDQGVTFESLLRLAMRLEPNSLGSRPARKLRRGNSRGGRK
jgi:hypothetical protein